jgi:hypothetical protein
MPLSHDAPFPASRQIENKKAAFFRGSFSVCGMKQGCQRPPRPSFW